MSSLIDTSDSYEEHRLEPYGPIGIISHTANIDFVKRVNQILYDKRLARVENNRNPYIHNPGYLRHNYIFDTALDRFQTGEGKFKLSETARGHDIYIITDVLSYDQTFNVFGYEHRYSPDDHYRDLLRIISTVVGKAKRVNVIIPFLYEGIQIKKKSYLDESLDCACVLKQLYSLGVSNLIVFDPHDSRMDNSVPLMGIEKPSSAYKIISTLISRFGSIDMHSDRTMVVSTDETGVSRAVFYASMLNLPLGIFYRQRDYATFVDGEPLIKHYQFIGGDVNGKDVLLIDDMIKTGKTMMTTATELKNRGARDIYYLAPFGLFTSGYEDFDEAYRKGLIKSVVCTNLIYRPRELLEKEWYVDVNLTPYIARLIDALNVDESIGKLISSTTRITDFLDQIRIDEIIDDLI